MADDVTNVITKKRTTRYTDAEICAALRATNGMVYLAAKHLGCAPVSIYRRIEKSAKVREIVDNSRGELLDSAETSLKSAVLAKEAWAVCFALKTVGKHRGYVERIEQTGANGGPVEIKAQDYRASIAPLAPAKGRSVGDSDTPSED